MRIRRLKVSSRLAALSLNKMYEYDILSLIMLFFTGAAAGAINVMAGGGSSIVLPVLIFLGIDPTVANGAEVIPYDVSSSYL